MFRRITLFLKENTINPLDNLGEMSNTLWVFESFLFNSLGIWSFVVSLDKPQVLISLMVVNVSPKFQYMRQHHDTLPHMKVLQAEYPDAPSEHHRLFVSLVITA